MARWNGAVWRPLGAQSEPRLGKVNVVCLHTMVGYLKTTEDMFLVDGYYGTESHFGIGGKWGPDAAAGLDGVAWQWQDTSYQADANGPDGNDYVISIETADNAPHDADDLEPWTPKQLDTIVACVVWACRTYDLPAELIPDTKPGRRGIAYHRQGCTPNVVAGGDFWSESKGKVCPGDARVRQVKEIIIPRVRAALAGIEEDEMGASTFVAWYEDPATGKGTPYWIEPAGKRKLTPDNATKLKELTGIKDVGKVPSSFLNEFPTYDEAGTAGGSTVSQLVAADDVPPATTPPASGAGG